MGGVDLGLRRSPTRVARLVISAPGRRTGWPSSPPAVHITIKRGGRRQPCPPILVRQKASRGSPCSVLFIKRSVSGYHVEGLGFPVDVCTSAPRTLRAAELRRARTPRARAEGCAAPTSRKSPGIARTDPGGARPGLSVEGSWLSWSFPGCRGELTRPPCWGICPRKATPVLGHPSAPRCPSPCLILEQTERPRARSNRPVTPSIFHSTPRIWPLRYPTCRM